MQLDRSKLLRGLDLVNVGGIEQVVVAKTGEVRQISSDRIIIAQGNLGVGGFEDEWTLPDISLFARMLKSFTSSTLEVTRARNSFEMVAGGIKWRYRLGDASLIARIEAEKIDQIEASLKHSVTTTVDVLKRISEIQGVVKAAYIHFVSKEGKMEVLIGESDTYSGSISLESSQPEDFDLKIPATRFVEIISKIDSTSVVVKFGKAIKIEMPDFSWYIGTVKTTN